MDQESRLQAAMLRVSMELRMKKHDNIQAATRAVATKMNIEEKQLTNYLSGHFNQLLAVSQQDHVSSRFA